MNLSGILVGIGAFAIIGIFHPIVIKTEYHFGKGVWPIFLVSGIICNAISMVISNVALSSLTSVLGFTLFWSIKELFEQEVRVSKGWYPKNPKRQSKATGSNSN
ncbi:DUF4491 family protein [Tissierella praeacuta]|uniref:DUF4491 family protein n=1 Tax=Tissierella praeacuta TaxID=43131 RepID=UPI001C118153|nr:DUF4491 family protein [Tissierella praeacuta]MBU5256135.1 DUF4491 family protein [Tissierella praeacuta]